MGSCWAAGAANDSDWSTRRDTDYFDLKGVVESVLATLRAPEASFEVIAHTIDGYANGTGARIVCNGEPVGMIGQIAPDLLAAHRIQTAVFAAELFLGKLVAAQIPNAVYQPLPRFPGVYRDLSFVVKKDVAYKEIEQVIRAAAGPYLESVECIDVFAGKGIGQGSRSIAVSLAFRASDRTLSSEEVAAGVDRVIAGLAHTWGRRACGAGK